LNTKEGFLVSAYSVARTSMPFATWPEAQAVSAWPGRGSSADGNDGAGAGEAAGAGGREGAGAGGREGAGFGAGGGEAPGKGIGGDSTGGGVTDWATAVAPKAATIPTAIQITSPTRSKPAQLITGQFRRRTVSERPFGKIGRAILRPDSPRGAS
jgi:hypothetical protein